MHCLDAITAKNELKSKSVFAKGTNKIILPKFEKIEEEKSEPIGENHDEVVEQIGKKRKRNAPKTDISEEKDKTESAQNEESTNKKEK